MSIKDIVTGNYSKNLPREQNFRKRRKEKYKESGKLKEYTLSPKGRFCSYKNNARTNGIDFSLSFEQFMNYWQGYCNYCGSKISTIGLDRIDSNKGYNIDNIVSCCQICNYAKRDLPLEIFYEWVEKVYNKMKGI